MKKYVTKKAAGFGSSRAAIPLLAFVFNSACVAAYERPNASAKAESTDILNFYLSDSVRYEDNLYRLSNNFGNTNVLIGPGASRDDIVNTAAFGASTRLFAGRQTFNLEGRIENNHFQQNDNLDHNAGNAAAVWDWVFGSAFSGKVGAMYSRSLADFAYTRTLDRDMLTRKDYYVDARMRFTPRWSLSGEAKTSRADQSTSINATENTITDSWKAGLIYETPRMDSFGFDYAHSKTRLPDYIPVNGVDRNYEDHSGVGWLKYQISEKTQFELRAGHLQRSYTQSSDGDFSGAIGRATAHWQPTVKTSFDVSAWRELQAYSEVGSEYFVSEGVSLKSIWNATDVFGFALTLSRENNNYKSENANVVLDTRRRDEVFAGEFAAIYTPRDWAKIDLSYRHQNRSSNRDLQDYTANVVALTGKILF